MLHIKCFSAPVCQLLQIAHEAKARLVLELLCRRQPPVWAQLPLSRDACPWRVCRQLTPAPPDWQIFQTSGRSLTRTVRCMHGCRLPAVVHFPSIDQDGASLEQAGRQAAGPGQRWPCDVTDCSCKGIKCAAATNQQKLLCRPALKPAARLPCRRRLQTSRATAPRNGQTGGCGPRG